MQLEGRDLTRLRDIEIYASRALDYLTHADGQLPSTLIQDAILRCFDVIGEAARTTSAEVKAAYPAIPWPFMVAMRNRVIHEYHRVDLALVYKTVQNDLPELIAKVRAILAAHTSAS